MILGDAEQHEVFGVLPVRLAEFPERAADGVEPRRRHVDRAEAAVRGEVGRAELLRPPAGQRLALVAAGEERELARIAARGSAPSQPVAISQRLVPLDLDEFAGAALAPTRFSGLRSRDGEYCCHDAGRALARTARPLTG